MEDEAATRHHIALISATAGENREKWTRWVMVCLCASGSVIALATACDLVFFAVTARAASKLADPPRISKLLLLAGLLTSIGISLGVSAWRSTRLASAHRSLVSRWSIGSMMLWSLLLLYAFLLYYPLPYHSHHIDKLLLIVAVALLWTVVFVLWPKRLSAFLHGAVYAWTKILFINILIFAFMGEAAFRVLDPVLARNGLFSDKHSPAGLTPYAATRGSIGRTNSQGFRDRERIVQKKPGTLRLLALGDSFTYGAGVTYDEIFTTLLERELQTAAPHLEIVNLGVSGWDPAQEFHLLKAYGMQFRPDLVMLNFFVGNDILRRRGAYVEEPIVVAGRSYYIHTTGNWLHDTWGPDRWYLYHHLNYLWTIGKNRLETASMLEQDQKRDLGSWRPMNSRRSYLKDIDERSDIYFKEDTPLFHYHWEKTIATLDGMSKFLKSKGASFVLVLLPAHEQLDLDLQHELAAALDSDLRRYDFEKPQRLLREWAQQRDVSVIDLLPAFQQADPSKLYFENDIHWTESAHRLAAATMLPVLQRLLAMEPMRRGL